MKDDELPAESDETENGMVLRDGTGIRYINAYTPDNPPTKGDIVWGRFDGDDSIVLGRHIVPGPDGPVTP